MERQALRDAVIRFHAEGLAGLVDRPHGRSGRFSARASRQCWCTGSWSGRTRSAGSRRTGRCRTSAALARSGSARPWARPG
ncbi:hypothetical protein [Methylobacterium sp. 4-46]|uniref:hypothetical protein n=1 Tax=Methylobacterium sp. CB376 TaxID=3138063 RepID=UPI0012374A0E